MDLLTVLTDLSGSIRATFYNKSFIKSDLKPNLSEEWACISLSLFAMKSCIDISLSGFVISAFTKGDR